MNKSGSPTKTYEDVARTCSPAEILATTHALLLRMARAADGEAFPGEMQGALILAMKDAGLTPDTTQEQWDVAVKDYVATRPVRADLLDALKSQLRRR